MAKNTGKPYELLTQRVFTEILNEKSANTIKVEHDVTIQGKETTHQVDVYWEFEVGGITYRTIVQCKDWIQPVKQEQIFAFTGVLRDIPGQPRGVFVTRTGYQSGAIEIAKANGILLYELREPTKEDFGGITGIQTTLRVLEPQLVSANVIHDQTWALEEKQRRGLSAINDLELTVHVEQFEDEQGNVQFNVNDLVNEMIRNRLREDEPLSVHHDFAAPTYIKTGRPDFSRLKVTAVEFTIVTRSRGQPDVFTIRFKDLVNVILRDVLTGTKRPFEHAVKPLSE